MAGTSRGNGSAPTAAARRVQVLTPWRTRMALRRSATQWRLLAVVTAVAVTACTLVTTLGVLVTATEDGAVRGALTASSAADTLVTVTLTEPVGTAAATTQDVGTVVDETLGGAVADAASSVVLSALGVEPRQAQIFGLAYFGEFDGIAENATLVDGEWPSLPAADATVLAVALPEPAALARELAVGDTIRLADQLRGTPRELVVTGIYRVLERGGLYWAPDLLDGEGYDESYPVPGSGGSLATDATGPLILAPGTFDAIELPIASLVVRQSPDLSETNLDALLPLLDRLDAASDRLPVALGEIADAVSYRSSLTSVLQSVAAALTVTRGTVLVLSLLLLVLATVALTQTARLLNEARVGERNLMRARGATARQVLGLATIEAIAVAALTLAVSPFLARLLFLALADQPAMAAAGMTADPGIAVSTWLTAGVIAVLFAVVLVAPLIRRGGTFHEGEQARSRASKASGLQRSGIDLAIVVIAALAYWQLLFYRSPVGDAATLAVDPVLAAGPVLALLAGALMAVRLVPLVARVAERVAARGAGVVAPLAAWEIGRRSQQATAAILLLTLALAVGTFSQSFLATWRQSQVDQAAYAFGPPARVQGDGSEAVGSTLRHPPSTVGNPQPVLRSEVIVAGADAVSSFLGAPDGTDAVLVAATSDARDMLVRDDVSGESGSIIAETLERSSDEVLGSDLALDIRGLAGTVRLETRPAIGGIAATVRAVIQYESGLLTTLELGTVPVDGTDSTVSAMLPESEWPAEGEVLRLVGMQAIVFADESYETLEVNPTTPASLLVRDIQSLTAGATDEAEPTAVPVEVDLEQAWFSSGDAYARSFALGAVHREGWQVALNFTVPAGMSSGPIAVLHMGWPGEGTVRAVFDTDLAASMKVKAGAMQTLVVGGNPVPISVAAVVEHVPGGGSATSFNPLSIGTANSGAANDTLLVDQASLSRALIQNGFETALVSEWWVDLPEGSGQSYLDDLTASQIGLTGQSAETLARQMQEHPLRVATQAALWLVIGGAAVLAAVGFGVHATGTLRSRAVEFAQLRAVGLSRRRLVGVIATESLLVSFFGILFGLSIGVLLGWLVGPLVGASSDGTPTVPEVAVQFPIADIALLALEIVIVVVVVVLVAARTQRVADPATVLRRGEER